MDAHGRQLWGIRRGDYRFAVVTDTRPPVISGEAIWWTPDHGFYAGIASADPRPLGVMDPAHILTLPARIRGTSSVVMTGGTGENAWALLSDSEPELLTDTSPIEVPWLPTVLAREHLHEALECGGHAWLLLNPSNLLSMQVTDASFLISEERLKRRTAHEDHRTTESLADIAFVAAVAGDVWLALRNDAVKRVVRAEQVTPLPGASSVVAGLTAIAGRVNLVLDPARLLEFPAVTAPCWVAQVRDSDRRWGIATENEWRVLTRDDLEQVDDRTQAQGPPGLIAQRLCYRGSTVLVLSLEVLAELAGASTEASP
jgi:chemotaxis signal transduction protein